MQNLFFSTKTSFEFFDAFAPHLKQFWICIDLEYNFQLDGWHCILAKTEPVLGSQRIVPLFDIAMSEKKESNHWLAGDGIWRLNFQGAFSLGACVENSKTGLIQVIFRLTMEIVYSKISGCWYIANKSIKEEEIYDV